MKTTTVVLTDEQANRLEAEVERSGTPADVLIGRALDEFFGIASNGAEASMGTASESVDEPPAANESPFRWLIGIGRSDGGNLSENIEQILAEEWPRYIEEDSFGGQRSGEDPPAQNVPGPKHHAESQD